MDTTTQEGAIAQALVEAAKALADKTGLTAEGIRKAIVAPLQFASRANKAEALNETIARVMAKINQNQRCRDLWAGMTLPPFWKEIDYAYITAKAKAVVNEIHERSKPPLIKKPHRGKRIYMQRALTSRLDEADDDGLNSDGHAVAWSRELNVDEIEAGPPMRDKDDRGAAGKLELWRQRLRETFEGADFIAAIMLGLSNPSVRSVRNIQEKLGLSRRHIEGLKARYDEVRQEFWEIHIATQV